MSDLPISQEIFTSELTNDSLTILASSNLKAISIYNTTGVAGTVRGTLQVGSTASTAITIGENESFNVVAQGTSVLDGVTIIAPAGCTLNLTGLS